MHSDWSEWRTWPTERRLLFERRMANASAEIVELIQEAIVAGYDEDRARLMGADFSLNSESPVRSDAEWST